MLSSVIMSNVTWSATDEALLKDINLTFGAERTGLVGRNGVGKSSLLKLICGELLPHSGTVLVNGSVGFLRQIVQIESQLTVADLFGVASALATLNRIERGDANDDDFALADWTLESRIASSLADLKLDVAMNTPLVSLSGGQRTRAALAALIFDKPSFVLLDEPTNNLDGEGRNAVIDFLSHWRSGAIVVSHDRDLLDTMDAVVELTSLGSTRYGGNWSYYQERKAVELSASKRELNEAERRLIDVDRASQAAAERKTRKDNAGKSKRAKGDAPNAALNSMRDRSEKTGAENARLAERRRNQAQADVVAARERIEVLQPFAVALASTQLPANKTVLALELVSAGYDPLCPVVQDLSLKIVGPERIAIIGPNGSGKSTILSVIGGGLKPSSGIVKVFTPFAMLDQRMSLLDPSATIRDNFRRINVDADENVCRAALARFKFRADAALLLVSSLSGGQMIRAGLACVLGGKHPPPLLILDEPTNHLDVESVETVERGLCAYDGALLVVSHDARFLDAIGVNRTIAMGARPRGSLPRHRV
ncbi:ABC-F family ATP-binding cassette domain-containing protein [Rhizobium rhizogenes]|uniref:ATP-binding protein n=1 Tax=Rhizobium rhizogenes (strain K84 / ATCC BAA-868) TaxID=311403 RepID=B9JPU4_RHIR8|nr:ATP-binding protein [Rhizobium rhizogenes K84]NTG77920.1 ABC-F family ATP-binding cassette domain-containing protein [Rhizobium rhizogenes]